MRKLFLSVLALIVLAGTMFAPSNAWSQQDWLAKNGICSDLSYSADYTNVKIAEMGIFDSFSIIDNTNDSTKNIYNGLSTVPITDQVPGVTSFYISCSSCPIVNPKNDITINGQNQKRVTILLC